MIHLVSISGGKDSTATLLHALDTVPFDSIKGVFADTGNEHESTYQYVDYLQQQTGVNIHHVKADFSDRFQHRIEYVRDKWLLKGVTQNIVDSALSVLELGATGNPFLDLCILKGRFPSRMAQFCTQELKVIPCTEYLLELVEEFGIVESWQGVRAEESLNRANLPERENKGGGYLIYRPIHKWTVKQVFAIHKKHSIEANPLYKQGMNRVGCMPCINCSKSELLEISKRFPEHIKRIYKWEKTLCKVSKRQSGTFFRADKNENAFHLSNIFQKVEWSKTLHGGRKMDLFSVYEEPLACSSAYGLCE